MSRRRGLLLVLTAALLAPGGPGCSVLVPRIADVHVRKPGHLSLFISLEDERGEPVPAVPPSRFRFVEDGQPVSQAEARLRIRNPTLPLAHYTMVLVDTSGSVTTTGQLPRVVAAARDFAGRVAGGVHRMAVYRFDGAPKIEKVSDFGSLPGAAFSDPARYAPRDPSTNLYGAIIEALEVLKERRERGPIPLQVASLVVFTDGTDRARRVSREAAREAVNRTDIDVYVVAIPGEINQEELAALAKNGVYTFPAGVGELVRTFGELGRRLRARQRSYYLVSYCSAARAGERELVVHVDDGQRRGSVTHRFNADGFAPGCRPLEVPPFEWHPRYRHQAGDDKE